MTSFHSEVGTSAIANEELAVRFLKSSLICPYLTTCLDFGLAIFQEARAWASIELLLDRLQDASRPLRKEWGCKPARKDKHQKKIREPSHHERAPIQSHAA